MMLNNSQSSLFRASISFIVLLLQLCITPPLLAQKHEFQNYGVDEGLPSPWITASYQDNTGRIWAATARRVIKFDGYKFHSLLPLDSNDTQWVWNIKEDPKGVPWLLSAQATLYKVVGNAPIPHPANDTLITLFGNSYRHTFLGFGSGDTILIGFNSLSFYAKVAPDGTVKKVDLKKWEARGLIYVMENESVRLATSVARREKSAETVIMLNNRRYKVKNHPRISKTLVETAARGETIIANGRNVYKISEDGIESELLVSRDIVCMHVDMDLNVWLSLGTHVECWSQNLDRLLFSCLQPEFCNTILQDNEGTMWFGTINGLFRMIDQDITHYNEFKNGKLAKPHAPKIAGADSALWLQADKKIVSIKNDQIQEFPYSIAEQGTERPPLENVLISTATGMYQKGGPYMFRITPSRTYRSCIYESDGSFWTMDGINLVRIDKEQNVVFSAQDSDFSWAQPKIMNTFGELHFKDDNGHFWMTLGTFLYIFDGKALVRVKKRHQNFKLIYVLDAEKNGDIIWITTSNQGLWALYEDTLAHFSSDNGLQSGYNSEVIKESASCIWVAGFQGLTRIEYHMEDGKLQADLLQFEKNAGLKSSNIENGIYYDGYMWFTSKFGIAKLDIEKWLDRKIAIPKPEISDVLINDEPIAQTGRSIFPHDQNNVAIRFKSITFTGRERPLYSFRLLGADSNWHSTSDTSVQYSGLQPGKYKFQVSTTNNRNISSKAPSDYSFEISLPFWRTWWFILSVLLGIQLTTLSIVWGIARLRKRTLASEKNTLIAEVKALRLQVNPHFMFNALNNIREMVNQGEQTEAPQQILRFSQLMRKILNASKKENICLADEIDLIESYFAFAKARFQDKVRYNVHISAEVRLMQEVINIPPLITQPIIENALVHGASKAVGIGMIEVKFSRLEHHVRCRIIDNGPGFAPKESTTGNSSMGMSLVKDQIEKINASRTGEIRFSIFSGTEWNNGQGGTCAQLDIPIES